MKPSLLYLRRYIEQNYSRNGHKGQQTKIQKCQGINKNSQEILFKEKKRYEWENGKCPKSISSIKLKDKRLKMQKRKMNKEEYDVIDNEQKINQIINIYKIQSSNQRIKIKNEQEKQNNNTIQNKNINIVKREQNTNIKKQDKIIKITKIDEDKEQSQQKNKKQKQVKFVINPPKQNINMNSQMLNQNTINNQINKIQAISNNIPQTQIINSFNIAQQQQNQLFKIYQQFNPITQTLFKQQNYSQISQSNSPDHTKLPSKSMKRLGYTNLQDYINQMKKVQNIKKKIIQQAHYYPLACMTPQLHQVQQYQTISTHQKEILLSKINFFSNHIQVQQHFSLNSIQIDQFTPSKFIRKHKSNFSNKNKFNTQNKSKDPQNIDNKAKKFLLQYQNIVICNCANKKYFTYKFQTKTDYKSFFKFTTPLLNSQPDKQNNYLIGNTQNDYLGLYFCCLINASLGVRQPFFWIGKPLQYYNKNKVISVIDKFINDIQGFNILESDRIWIVDYHGRNSFINKNLLKLCNQKNQSVNKNEKHQKSRLSKRISLSMSQQLQSIQTSQIFMSLLANFSQLGQTNFIKKQRNNISTRGQFKMIYKSSNEGI